MSLPGLKSSIELESGPASPQLVDAASGQSLAITETEAKLLSLWDGAQSATALSAKAFVEGLEIAPTQVEKFFSRLSRANLLEASAPVAAPEVPPAAGPGVEEPEDIVPRLRGDLVITPSATSKGTLEVKDPSSERSFTLYDFEVSIARMLDGKRSAAEVLSAANKLGIPVTLPTLKTFLRQLQVYQFIDLTAGGGDSTWPKREQWSVEVRELYQSALRMMRAGKFDEAKNYAEAMIASDPSNEEAARLMERIEAEARGSKELNVPFDTLHTPVPDDAPPAPDPFASFGFHSEPPPAAALPPIPEEVAPVAPSIPPVTARERPGPTVEEPRAVPAAAPVKSKRNLIIGAAVGLVALLVLLRPVQGVAQLPCEVQVEELGVPRALRAGAVEALIPAGTRVEKGAVLARFTLTPEESADEGLDGKIKELQAKLLAPATATKKELTRAKATVKKANAAVIALNKKLKKATAKTRPGLEKKVAEKQEVLAAAKASLEPLLEPDQRVLLKEALEQLTAKKIAASVLRERSVITAPAAGLFLAPEGTPEKLAENDAYGRIVSPVFRAVTKEPLVTEELKATFSTPAGKAEVELVKTAAGVTARVEGHPKYVGAKGTLEVPLGNTVWILSVLR